MSMDATYQNWHKHVDELHFRVQDCFDERDHPACHKLYDEMRHLLDDLSQQKSPHDLEDRVRGIIDWLEPARNGSQTFMSVHDAVTFHDTFERLRREIHSHPHYS